MTTCKDTVLAADGYLDGTANAQQSTAVEAHVAECEPCARHLEQLKRTLELISQLEPDPVSAQTKAGLMRTFEAWHARPSFWRLARSWRHLAPALRLFVLAAPLVLVINHAACIMQTGLGTMCFAQTLGIALLPFAAALYSSVRSELGAPSRVGALDAGP